MRKLTLVLAIVLTTTAALAAADYYTKYKGDQRRGEPTDDQALVYVLRPAIGGGAIKTWSFADDQLIGVTKGKGYAYALVPAGNHVVWAAAENVSATELELEGGKTYYFKTAIRPGVGKARVKLMQIDEAEAEGYFEKCSYCEPTAEGRQRAEEIAAERGDTAVEKARKRAEKEDDSDSDD